ncbi:MAG: helix-hairpin-helix domain-containing protein [Actinomycetota bacterium]
MSRESLRDRLSALSRAELAGLALVVAVTLGGAGLWYVRSLPRPVEVRTTEAPMPSGASAHASPGPTILIVDVAGWVRRPGVYEFHEGDRVIDAIEAAGGARRGASLASLNLAMPLVDGTQVLVPRTVAGGASGAVASGSASMGKVNINTATASELEALPGVGEVIAQRIVDYRTANGPFGSVDELIDVSGIGESTLASMRELVTV